MKSFSESYKKAGVDVTAGYKAVELMKAHVEMCIRDSDSADGRSKRPTGISVEAALHRIDVWLTGKW